MRWKIAVAVCVQGRCVTSGTDCGEGCRAASCELRYGRPRAARTRPDSAPKLPRPLPQWPLPNGAPTLNNLSSGGPWAGATRLSSCVGVVLGISAMTMGYSGIARRRCLPSPSPSPTAAARLLKDTLTRTRPHSPLQPALPGPLSPGPALGKNRFGYRYTRASWTLGQRLVQVPKIDVAAMPSIKGPNPAIIRPSSPAPLTQDFARQQVSKQQRSNFHSSSLSIPPAATMVSQSVNKTALHPTGVQ